MFTNQIIDTQTLPQFENIPLKPLKKSYFKIVLFNVVLVWLLIGGGFLGTIFFKDLKIPLSYYVIVLSAFTVFMLFILLVNYFEVKSRGFAFRTHDAVYKSGIIKQTTFIVPYNRVQHVALHQGWISRKLGLAKLELFTAGGSTSDLQIPGISVYQAKLYKDVVVKKMKALEAENTNIKEVSALDTNVSLESTAILPNEKPSDEN